MMREIDVEWSYQKNWARMQLKKNIFQEFWDNIFLYFFFYFFLMDSEDLILCMTVGFLVLKQELFNFWKS